MESLDEVLRERVDALTGSKKARLLSTTGTQAAIAELIARSDRLEKALGEISSRSRRSPRHRKAARWRATRRGRQTARRGGRQRAGSGSSN